MSWEDGDGILPRKRLHNHLIHSFDQEISFHVSLNLCLLFWFWHTSCYWASFFLANFTPLHSYIFLSLFRVIIILLPSLILSLWCLSSYFESLHNTCSGVWDEEKQEKKYKNTEPGMKWVFFVSGDRDTRGVDSSRHDWMKKLNLLLGISCRKFCLEWMQSSTHLAFILSLYLRPLKTKRPMSLLSLIHSSLHHRHLVFLVQRQDSSLFFGDKNTLVVNLVVNPLPCQSKKP